MKFDITELQIKTKDALKDPDLNYVIDKFFFDVQGYYLYGARTKQHLLIFINDEGKYYNKDVLEAIKTLLKENKV